MTAYSSGETEAPVVRVDSIVKDFRPGLGLRTKRVLHGVSFEVQRGEVFGFVGPNGSGKTTTLKLLMGLIRPTSGAASILGCDVEQTAFRRHIGYLPENPWFYPFLSAREILHFYARLAGMSPARRHARVEELLAWVGLQHASDARLRTYSKGMLQRVGIAQALVHDPAVVFLDEPMSGLDPLGRKEMRDIILRLQAEGKTVFMNSHILSDVEMICGRVAIIVSGRIRYQGRIEDFLREDEMMTDIVASAVGVDVAENLEQRFEARLRGLGERLEIRVRDKSVTPVLSELVSAGADIVSVSRHRMSLERVFLDTIEGSRREVER